MEAVNKQQVGVCDDNLPNRKSKKRTATTPLPPLDQNGRRPRYSPEISSDDDDDYDSGRDSEYAICRRALPVPVVGSNDNVIAPTAAAVNERSSSSVVTEFNDDDDASSLSSSSLTYRKRRQKNNEAARRSRQKRRQLDAELRRQMELVIAENVALRHQLTLLRSFVGLPQASYDDGGVDDSDVGSGLLHAVADDVLGRVERKSMSSTVGYRPPPSVSVKLERDADAVRRQRFANLFRSEQIVGTSAIGGSGDVEMGAVDVVGGRYRVAAHIVNADLTCSSSLSSSSSSWGTTRNDISADGRQLKQLQRQVSDDRAPDTSSSSSRSPGGQSVMRVIRGDNVEQPLNLTTAAAATDDDRCCRAAAAVKRMICV